MTDPVDTSAVLADIPGTPTQPDPAAEVQRLTAELEQARAESGKAKAEHDAFVRKTSLEGKVTDVNTAMKVLDPERHLNEDGSVNVYALYDDFPILAPNVTTPTAPDGGGGSHFAYSGGASLENAARTGSPGEINAALDAELKGGRK